MLRKTPLARGTSQLKRTPLSRGTKKLAKKAKSHTASWYRQECVKVAKMIVRHRDGYKCVKEGCEKSIENGDKVDCSHVKAESHNHAMSANPLNMKLLCFKHHDWWHLNPTESGKWFEETYPERAEILNELSKQSTHKGVFEWRNELAELKEIYNKLVN